MFLRVTLDFYTSEDAIHSVDMREGNTPNCSPTLSLRCTDLISATNEVSVSRNLNSAYGVSLNLDFGE